MKTKNCRTCWGNLVICLKKSNVFKSTFKKISKPGKFCYWFLLIPCMYFYENMKAFFLIWLCVWRLHYGLLFSIVTLVAVFLYSLWIFLNVWRSLRFFFFKDQQGEKQNDFSNTKLRRTVDAKASEVFCVAIRNILCAFDTCTFFFPQAFFIKQYTWSSWAKPWYVKIGFKKWDGILCVVSHTFAAQEELHYICSTSQHHWLSSEFIHFSIVNACLSHYLLRGYVNSIPWELFFISHSDKLCNNSVKKKDWFTLKRE